MSAARSAKKNESITAKYRSPAIALAKRMNNTKSANLDKNTRVLEREHARNILAINKETVVPQEELREIQTTKAIPGEMLERYHQERKMRQKDIQTHIAKCYVDRQVSMCMKDSPYYGRGLLM